MGRIILLRLRPLVVVLIFLFVQTTSGFSQSWLSVDGSMGGDCYSIEVIESTLSGYKARIRIHGLLDDIITVGGSSYHILSLGSESVVGNLGEPQIPAIPMSLAIPPGAEFKAEITSEVWETIPVGDIYPIQEPLLETEVSTSFLKSDSLYSCSEYYPVPVSVSEEMNWRSINNRSVICCPFRYYPREGRLSVMKEFCIEVDFSHQSGLQKNQWVQTKNNSAEVLQSLFDNANIIPEYRDSHTRSVPLYDMLIIVGGNSNLMTSQCLQDFKMWKAFKGFNTKMVSTTETGATSDSIKAYIASEYQLNSNLQYVLFIGDANAIPTYELLSPAANLRRLKHMNDTINGDYWYGCLDGNDYLAEVSIGRFPTSSIYELSNMISKTIRYESLYRSIYNKALMVISVNDSAGTSFRSNIEDVLSRHYLENLQFTSLDGGDSIIHGGHNATNTQFFSSVNDGYNIVNYRGHGKTPRWYKWNYLYESIYSSDTIEYNQDVLSNYFSIACWTGNIKNDSCMLYNYMRPDYGAVSYIGATTASFHDANNPYEKNLFWYLLSMHKYNIGLINNLAHINCITNQTNNVYKPFCKDNAFIYICGGDPTLEIWTAIPSSFSNVSITPTSSGTISLSLAEDAIVSVVSEYGEVVDTLHISGCRVLPQFGNVNYYAINKHNYLPYVFKVDYASDKVQNVTINMDTYYLESPISVGYNVDNALPLGNVTVKSGKSLHLNKTSGVTIKNGFTVEEGATLTIE